MDDHRAYDGAELAEIYDAIYAHVDDGAFWGAMAAAAEGGPILELASGTGRVLLPLARAGHEVTGLDLSAHMLDRCRAKLTAEPVSVRDRVTLVEADMTSFELGRRYAAIFCAFNSFHHLGTMDAQLACLERCHAHLMSQGVLVLDLFNPDPQPVKAEASAPTDAEAAAQVIEWTDGRHVRSWMSACEYNRQEQRDDCEMTYEITEADGAKRRLTETFPLRWLYRFELEHLLARTGFRLVKLYGGYDRSRFDVQSIGMIAVALRR
jgi:SAM-dependent methyltransferase